MRILRDTLLLLSNEIRSFGSHCPEVLLNLCEISPIVLTVEGGTHWISLRQQESVAGGGKTWKEALTDFQLSIVEHLHCLSPEQSWSDDAEVQAKWNASIDDLKKSFPFIRSAEICWRYDERDNGFSPVLEVRIGPNDEDQELEQEILLIMTSTHSSSWSEMHTFDIIREVS